MKRLLYFILTHPDLSIALTRPRTGQEVHVLFILIILSTTILFCHSLVRLCMLSFRPQRVDEIPRIPDMAGPEGFQPDQPIRVHLARDEELAEEADPPAFMDPEKEILKAPPPAYGLWRCSVVSTSATAQALTCTNRYAILAHQPEPPPLATRRQPASASAEPVVSQPRQPSAKSAPRPLPNPRSPAAAAAGKRR